MKRKLLVIALPLVLVFLFVSQTQAASVVMKKIEVAVNSLTIKVNGSKINTDNFVYNGTTYVPLRAVSESLGKEVVWDNETRTVHIDEPGTSPSSNSVTHNGITIKVDKVTQDSDSLKVYISYINHSGSEVMTADSLARIVANGSQYNYDSNFNFDRFYQTGVDKAPDSIEDNVTAKSVIFFKPIPGVKKINIVLNADFIDFRYNDISVQQ
jgi:hypothetical protein